MFEFTLRDITREFVCIRGFLFKILRMESDFLDGDFFIAEKIQFYSSEKMLYKFDKFGKQYNCVRNGTYVPHDFMRWNA